MVLCHEKEKGDWASDGSEWRLYASENKKSASPADAYLGENEWRERAAFHQEIPSIARVDRWLAREPKSEVTGQPDDAGQGRDAVSVADAPVQRGTGKRNHRLARPLRIKPPPSTMSAMCCWAAKERTLASHHPQAGSSSVFQRGRRETDSTDPGTGKGPHHPAHPRHLETGHTSGVLRQRDTGVGPRQQSPGETLDGRRRTASRHRGLGHEENRPKKRQYAFLRDRC